MVDFASAVEQFKYTEEERVKSETLRRQFLERFPASNLGAMTLKQYCLGHEPKENSFCYWLEFKTRSLGGIGGGGAYKFFIFYSQERNDYAFASRFKTKEEALETVKSGILELLRLVREDKVGQCESVPPFERMTLVRGKIINLYFPEKLLPIFSVDQLRDFCAQLGVQADLHSQTSMNLALLNFKNENALVKEWSNDKFARLLYERFPPTIQFWKVAPGENARLWSECRKDGLICVGWNEVGDMRQYADASAFKEMYRKLYGANKIRHWKEIWSFAKEIKEGDVIVANNGLKSIVGIGTVTGDYWYNAEREEYKHCLPVKWEVTTEFPIPQSAHDIVSSWFRGTVKKIDRDEYNRLVGETSAGAINLEFGQTVPLPSSTSNGRYAEICKTTFLPEQFFADCEQLLRTKKQIVLQGAPGTGKTFVAEHLARLWAGNAERVKIVQFHESYGYEDFVQGLKPKRDPVTKKTAFVPTRGIFLRFCEEIKKDKTSPPPHYVLLIDEINRAKTARVFGELLYLLEYRDKDVELQNGMLFSIPQNLYIIGTMNTTDKSIALVDYALRRRFAFVDLVPVKDGHSVVLKKWLESNGISNAEEVDDLFIALNDAIAQRDEALMVGHSFFMLKQAVAEKWFSPELLEFLWTYFILPLIAEYEYQSTSVELEEKYGLAALHQAAKWKAT